MAEKVAMKPRMGARYGDDWKYDVNWNPIDDKPADDLVVDELERARTLERDEAKGRYNTMIDEMYEMNGLTQLRRNRRKRLGGPGKANVKATRVAELGPLGRVGANARATPRDVAVMSNTVHSIGRRKKPRIGRSEPELVAASLNAMRLVLALLFRVRAKTDYAFEEFKFSVPELGRTIGLHYRMTREQTEKLLRDMNSVDFACRTDEGCFVTAPFMAISKLDETGTSVRLQLNEKLEPYLLDLRKYRQLHRSVLALQSVRAMLLYIFVRKYIGLRWKQRPRIPLADLLNMMQVDKRMPWALFRRDHLEPAIYEITRKTEVKITYSAERGGRLDRKRGEVEAVFFEMAERKVADGANKQMGKVLLIPPRNVTRVNRMGTSGKGH